MQESQTELEKSYPTVGSPGFRYRSGFSRPGKNLIDELKKLMSQTGCLTGNVGDSLNRLAGMDARIRSLVPNAKMAGPAITVNVPAGDNLMIHKAMTLIQPGDVLVIDGKGDGGRALLGALLVQGLMKIGAAGVVVDGVIRDLAEIRQSGFPVFASGACPNGPYKDGPGEIGFGITCGGRIVNAGDVIVADDDGVVVVPMELLAQVIEKTHKIIEWESGVTSRMVGFCQGQAMLPNLDQILAQKGLV